MSWSNLDAQRREDSQFQTRLWWSLWFIIIVFVGLVCRLVYLQVWQHQHYVTASDDNRQQLQALAPTRGLIYDTHGSLLAGNRASHSLTLVPEQLSGGRRSIDKVLAELGQILTLDDSDIKRFKRRLTAMILHPSGESSEQETAGEVVIRRSVVMTGCSERHMTSSSSGHPEVRGS